MVTRAWLDPQSLSSRLFEKAQQVMPGGNTRATVYTPPYPPYAASGQGCWLTDVEGERRLDYLNNYTTLIHGHAHPLVVEAAIRRLEKGACFSMPTAEEVDLAAVLTQRLSSVEQIRFTNSGTEAVMMAVKAARAHTGRRKIAKCEGAYHGSYDYVEVSLAPSSADWGSLTAPTSVAYAKGTPDALLDDVIVIPFNRPEIAVERIEQEADSLAAVIIDLLPSRLGLIAARPEFVRALRTATARHGILLICDEVISFRLGYHGAQGLFGLDPDLTTLGKIIGGGFPVGAVGGRADIMSVFDPRGGRPAVPHGGTFSANPVTMAAGLAAMELLTPGVIEGLNELGEKLRAGIQKTFARMSLPGSVTGMGSLFRIHPHKSDGIDYRTMISDDTELGRSRRRVERLLEHGVMISPTGLGCLSTPMGASEVDLCVDALATSLKGEMDN